MAWYSPLHLSQSDLTNTMSGCTKKRTRLDEKDVWKYTWKLFNIQLSIPLEMYCMSDLAISLHFYIFC